MPNVVFQQIAQPGPGYAATSTTSFTIGPGSKTFATQTGLAYTAGARVRVSYASDGTKYMEGLVTSYSGTTLVVNVDTVGGSGTFASWNINLAGNVGTTGATGPGYLATSTTSLTPATGSKTFTTQAGLAYLAGLRVRAVSASDVTVWMEGPVSSYSGTSLVLTVDLIGTATTKADWNIGAAGTQGAAGTNGTNASAANWRGAYASGTTYAQGDGVSYSGSDYVSLAGSNTGHQPDTSPTWWQNIGTSGLQDPGSNGIVKRTALNTTAAAVSGADYAPATSGTSILKGNGAGGFSAAGASDLPVFVASGASHAPGAVPDPGSTAGSTNFLREDATWATPNGGGVTTQSVPSRAFATVYQNTTCKPLMVSVTIGTNFTNQTVQAYTDSSNPPTTLIGQVQGYASANELIPIVFWVLPNNYYKVTTTGSGPGISKWLEWY